MEILSASHRATNDVIFSLIKPELNTAVKILDFGAGQGYMSQRLGSEAEARGHDPANCIYPCEIVPEEFKYDKVVCKKIGTDSVIPFEDNFFDVVYAIEVLEHTFRPYDFMKEAYRVLKSNGTLIISVPNVSHILSRFSNLFYGYNSLFPPPSKHVKNAGRICGHIMPLSYPYFHYGCAVAGFKTIDFKTDRKKRSCLFWATLFWPIHKLCIKSYDKNLRNYDKDVWQENSHLINTMNSIDMLTSRSCIVVAKK